MSVADLGITDEEVADQYQYTKDVMTDSDGNLKGLSWQGCPGAMIYRRDIAKKYSEAMIRQRFRRKLQTGIHLRQQLKS